MQAKRAERYLTPSPTTTAANKDAQAASTKNTPAITPAGRAIIPPTAPPTRKRPPRPCHNQRSQPDRSPKTSPRANPQSPPRHSRAVPPKQCREQRMKQTIDPAQLDAVRRPGGAAALAFKDLTKFLQLGPRASKTRSNGPSGGQCADSCRLTTTLSSTTVRTALVLADSSFPSSSRSQPAPKGTSPGGHL